MARALAVGLALAFGSQAAAARELLAVSQHPLRAENQCTTITNLSAATVTGVYCSGASCGSTCFGGGSTGATVRS